MAITLTLKLPRVQPTQSIEGGVLLVGRWATHAVGQRREQNEAVDEAAQDDGEQSLLDDRWQSPDHVFHNDSCGNEEIIYQIEFSEKENIMRNSL